MNKLRNIADRLTNRVTLMVSVMLAALTFGVSGAGATPPTLPADPTGGAMGDTQTNVQTWVMTYGAPVLFALIALGILIRLGTKWAKRAGKSV